MFGTLKMCRKKCPYKLFEKTLADKLDVTKSVPNGCKLMGAKMLGYPKECHYLCDN